MKAGSWTTRPASASAETASAFHAVTTLSSVGGGTRFARAAANAVRASGNSSSEAVSTFMPSQFPSGVAPNAAAASGPTSEASSSHVQTANFPSMPSESASCEEEKAPPGCRSSARR